MKVAFRADASLLIGTGHVMRCKTLADELRGRGAEVRFVCREHPGHLIPLLHDAGYSTASLPAPQDSSVEAGRNPEDYSFWLGVSQRRDAEQTLEALSNFNPDWLVADHYGLDATWEMLLRPKVGRIFAIDDLANRFHDCDILLDHNAHEDAEGRYRGKLPAACMGLFGPRYALLRPEFARAKHQLDRKPGSIKRVLVAFSGATTAHDTITTLDTLERLNLSSIDVDVVIGPQYPEIDGVSQRCSRHAGWRLHGGTNQMATLIRNADLAIGAGGTNTWERIYLRLPAFVKVAASNQAEALTYLARLNQVKLWRDTQELADLLAAHIASGIVLPRFPIHFGTHDVAERIFPLTTLVPFGIQHVRRTYRWLSDPKLREAFLFTIPPTISRHCQYWRSVLRDPGQSVFAIYFKRRHVGNCGFKHIDNESGQAELWIYVGENDFRGCGLGEAALTLLEKTAKQQLRLSQLYLHAGTNNNIAVSLYEKAGFVGSSRSPSAEWGARAKDIILMEKAL